MKKIISAAMCLSLLALSGCNSTGSTGNSGSTTGGSITNVGLSIFKSSVDSKCRSELEKQNAWRIARVAMNAEQEENAKTKICSCVSEEAPNHVTVVDMTNATVDPQYRAQLVTKVVAKSLQTCYADFVK